MRNRLTVLTAALLLSSHVGTAQTPPPAAAPEAIPSMGLFDFGFRGTSVDGDEARHERYADLSDGAASRFLLNKETATYAFDATAFNIGYRDQRYSADYARRGFKFSFLWDSIPLNYSYITRTPFDVGNNGVLTLDAAARAAVQGPTNAANDGSAVGVPCAPGALPATCNNPTNADLAKANRSIYNTLTGEAFELRVRRDTAAVGGTYQASEEVAVHVGFTTTDRSGEMPWGASFAFNNGIELPLPLDQRTNDLSAGIEWSAPRGMFRIGWDGSWFDNDVSTLVWDNPIRATNFTNGLAPPNGPYDPNGYSNGNGPAQGRMSLPPDNSMSVFSVTGLYKMARRTSLNGTFQFTSQNQDDTLIPWTINPVVANDDVYAAFPHLAELPRDTARAKARGFNFLLNFNSRPIRNVGVNLRYRVNERDNQTPAFDAKEWVRFDAVPEESEEGTTIQYDTTRQLFDANVSFGLQQFGTLRVGYGFDGYDRNGRGFSETSEDTFRVTFDTLASQYVSVRAAYDRAERRGEGFVLAGIDYELGPGGTQPTLRYYDESDRDRDRGSVLVTLTPMDMVDVYVSFAGSKEKYMPDTFQGRRDPFGLLNADVATWTVGANVRPMDTVTVGATFGRDRYETHQQSRNANPPPDPSWTDPIRNWTLDQDEQVNNFNLYLDLIEAVQRTDIRVSYDFSDSDNAFIHGGPRIAALSAAGQFIPLPAVTNSWNSLWVDLKVFITNQVGVGFAYLYEKLEISDFNTVDSNGPVGLSTQAGQPVTTSPTGEPRIDWLGGLMTGYGNRPYEGNTGVVRLLYRF
jgi:hypothetical protein